MRVWADIENSSGVVQGEGPLNNIISARVTRQLDGAGEIALDVPLADPRALELVDTEARVVIWGYAPGTVSNRVAGETDYTGATLSANSGTASSAFDNNSSTTWLGGTTTPAYLQVVFPTMQRVLSYNLQVLTPSGSPRAFSLQILVDGAYVDLDSQNITTWASDETRSFVLATPVESQTFRLYITAKNGIGTINVKELSLISDSYVTSPGEKRELGSGIIVDNSYADTGAGATVALAGPDIVDELKRRNTLLNRAYNNEPIGTVLDELIALVPGWSIDYTGVSGDIYARFDGASVLSALQSIADKQGYHFRLNSNRSIKFGDLGDSSGKRILQGGRNTIEIEANDDVLPITRLEKVETSRDLVNWIVPVGRGEGERSIDLKYSTRPYVVLESHLTNGASVEHLKKLTGVYADVEMAQSFQLDANSTVKSVRLRLRKVGTPTGTITIRIETNSSGDPSGVLANANATTTLSEASLTTTAAWYTIVFTNSFSLSASTTYWIVITSDRAASDTNYITVVSTVEGTYYAWAFAVGDGVGNWANASKTLLFAVNGITTSDYEIQSTTGPDSSTLYYLSDSASITTYGQIESVVSFDIAALSGDNPDLIAAANALYDAAALWLLEHKDKQTVYRCSVTNPRANLLPGQTVTLTYKGYVWDESGTKVSWADIVNQTFYILKVTEQYGSTYTINLDISDSMLPITTPASQVADIIQAATTQSVRIYNRMDDLPSTCGGRLTLTSGTPVTTSDVTAATVVYFTPYIHNQICLYNGNRWVPFVFEELGYDVSELSANTIYDVFIFDNAGLLTLDVTAWSNSIAGTSARATEIVRQNGVYVKSGATGYRYLGSIRITTTDGQIEDSAARRFVWNYHNRIARALKVSEATSHTYNVASYQAWNNTTTGTRVTFVVGAIENAVQVNINADITPAADDRAGIVNVGHNSTTAASASGVVVAAAQRFRVGSGEVLTPTIGTNYFQILEFGNATSAPTFARAALAGTVLG